ncbi:MAG: hypothetical protein PHW62_01530 [Candidatus Ratteibacteria bacterium]|nr:hypothetical protein [Candidatus Ratteibacteria bacterium]
MQDCLTCGYFKWTKDWGWHCSDDDPRYQEICRFNMFADIITELDKEKRNRRTQ